MALLTTGRAPDASLGPDLTEQVNATIRRLREQRAVERIWEADPDLWKPLDPDHAAVIRNRLGWLTSVDAMAAAGLELNSFVAEVRSDGYTDAVLLGMGGSSLAPEVFAETFGAAEDFLRLHVLDTTDPDSISELGARLDLARTLFIVSSKSGTTIETVSLFRHFWNLLKTELGDEEASAHFVVITDPGTPLETTVRERGLRRLFTNPPDIGGRYSALSYFGLVPAALLGIDIPALLERAMATVNSTRDGDPYAETSPLWLGAVLGAAARAGRDKLTLLLPPVIESFGYWIEQLIAESTGKEATGILPVEGEPVGAPERYGPDRLFVHFHVGEEPHSELDAQVQALADAGHPVVRLWLKDIYDLGAEMWRWEFATAVAGVCLGVDPFDEPNVTESKRNTSRLLDAFKRTGALPEAAPDFQGDIAAFGPSAVGTSSLADALRPFVADLRPGDYLAIMAYLARTAGSEAALDEIRVAVRDRLGVATTAGYGPRFLHSTGQFHKGGPATGHFLQITAEPATDLPVPGEVYTFGTLLRAQALGDLEALARRGYPVLRLHLTGDPVAGLRRIAAAVREAVGGLPEPGRA